MFLRSRYGFLSNKLYDKKSSEYCKEVKFRFKIRSEIESENFGIFMNLTRFVWFLGNACEFEKKIYIYSMLINRMQMGYQLYLM